MTPENALDTDLYEVLGVAPDATAAEITAAYRALARELHPDVNPDPDAAERFKSVTAAYDVLGDGQKRAEYDEFRSMVGSGFSGDVFGPGFDPGARGGGFDPAGFDAAGMDPRDLEDLLGGLFRGRGGARRGPRRGPDALARVPVSFADAVHGTTVTLNVAGGDAASSVPVRIPAGTETGDIVRVRGAGGPGSDGGPPGDLLVEVVIGSHPRLGRVGLDLTTEVTVPFTTAVLGGTAKVTGLDDTVTIRVPEGTQPGKVMRLRGRGVATPERTGDLLVTVDVAVPTNLSDDQRAAVEALRAALDTEVD